MKSLARLRRAYFDSRYGQLHVHQAIPPGGGFDEAVGERQDGAVVLDLNSASATDPSIPTNLVTIPGATSSTPIPNNSYGWIRFKAKVK